MIECSTFMIQTKSPLPVFTNKQPYRAWRILFLISLSRHSITSTYSIGQCIQLSSLWFETFLTFKISQPPSGCPKEVGTWFIRESNVSGTFSPYPCLRHSEPLTFTASTFTRLWNFLLLLFYVSKTAQSLALGQMNETEVGVWTECYGQSSITDLEEQCIICRTQCNIRFYKPLNQPLVITLRQEALDAIPGALNQALLRHMPAGLPARPASKWSPHTAQTLVLFRANDVCAAECNNDNALVFEVCVLNKTFSHILHLHYLPLPPPLSHFFEQWATREKVSLNWLYRLPCE